MKEHVKIKNVLGSLYDMSQLVKQSSVGDDKDLKRMRVLLQRAFDFNLMSVFQFDYLEKRLVLLHSYGDPFNLVDAVNFRVGKGATGWCLQHKKSLLIKNLERENGSERFFVNSFLSVPIIINAQLVGAVVMGSFRKEKFEDADRFLLEMAAPYLGSVLLKEQFKFEELYEA